METEIYKTGFTIICTFATSALTMGKWFHNNINKINQRMDRSINALNDEIKILSGSINTLDKNLAIQNTVLESCMRRNGKC
jgi:hypothetical protein